MWARFCVDRCVLAGRSRDEVSECTSTDLVYHRDHHNINVIHAIISLILLRQF